MVTLKRLKRIGRRIVCWLGFHDDRGVCCCYCGEENQFWKQDLDEEAPRMFKLLANLAMLNGKQFDPIELYDDAMNHGLFDFELRSAEYLRSRMIEYWQAHHSEYRWPCPERLGYYP